MNIQNLSKENKKATVELSADELIRICNVLCKTEEKKDDLYYKLYSELMIARDMCQYGHIDNFCMSQIVKARNSYGEGLTFGMISEEQAEIFNTYIEHNDIPIAFGNSDWNKIYSMIVGDVKSDKIQEWTERNI